MLRGVYMTPEEMLDFLCKKAPKQSKTLQAIYDVCKKQLASGSTDFSYAAIARLGNAQNVPKAQSIRNKTGENYQALIKCFEGNKGARTRVPKPKSSDAWADEIKDPKHRVLVYRLLGELAEARTTIKEFVPPGLIIKVDDRSKSLPDFRLTNIERRAIEHLKSDDFYFTWELTKGDKGDALNPQGKAVFKPGTMQAIEKILKHL